MADQRQDPAGHRVPGRRRGPRASVVVLTVVVVTWWLLIGAAVVVTLAPAPVASAPNPEPIVVPESTAHIKQPGLSHWPIPVERLAFDTYYRGFQESDEAAIESAFAVSEWIDVSDGQLVHIVRVDGEAIQVELLEGGYAGRRGWLKARHLAP